jgi:hypothetical protein
MVNFPAPIGGTSLPPDFAPSILFVVLYMLLVPLMVYRMFDRRSRTVLLIGLIIFSALSRQQLFNIFNWNPPPPLNRVVCSHCVQCRRTANPSDTQKTSNLHASKLRLGFLNIANNLVNLLVDATYGSERYPESAAASSKGGLLSPPPEGTPNLPRVGGSQTFWVLRSLLLQLAQTRIITVFDD